MAALCFRKCGYKWRLTVWNLGFSDGAWKVLGAGLRAGAELDEGCATWDFLDLWIPALSD